MQILFDDYLTDGHQVHRPLEPSGTSPGAWGHSITKLLRIKMQFISYYTCALNVHEIHNKLCLKQHKNCMNLNQVIINCI